MLYIFVAINVFRYVSINEIVIMPKVIKTKPIATPRKAGLFIKPECEN